MTTTTDLINNIKLRGSFPTANDLFSNADYLSILNDEVMNQVTPLLSKVNEEYFLAYQDMTAFSGLNAYRIPKRSIGSMLREVQLIDGSGNVSSLQRLFEEDKYSTSQGLLGYYLKSNQVILSPTPISSNYTLRFVYIRRPSKFVLPSACAQIIAISGNTITVSALPSTMTNNTLVDFVQGSSPYDLLQVDTAIASVSGTTLTFSSVPADLAVNDYISLAGEACVPMIPDELIPFLVQSALVICLASKKDNSVELEVKKLEEMKKTLIDLLTPRVKDNSVKIKSSALLNHFRGY
jgi:hypothetical protein